MRRRSLYIILTLLFGIFLYLMTMPPKQLPSPSPMPADSILVEKAARKLHLLRNGQIFKSYDISLGFSPVGHKQKEGDGKTPEGSYIISGRNPHSAYYLSLRISYPNARDRENARKRKVSPGGDIMIHGLPNRLPFLGKSHLLKDWTAGCIAVTNEEIAEIWSLVPDNTPIEIKP